MLAALVVPFGLQAAALLFDDFYFHRRRGLPLWERLGHPIDTASVLACFVFLLRVPQSPSAIRIYAVLAIVSCLCVTKDEFVHAEKCSGGEHWLHAVSFILHPLVLIAGALLWHLPDNAGAQLLLRAQTALLALVFAYQVLYWNIPWPKR
jgi:hypothetical protein